MPGILPMKVIKVGVNAQARIAQACDRCRSKKIRCDGVRPCCSQCENVGFECKTSDKLSRRAFPRGYTESLEDRVRSLESEVRELKDLLDEKDEKIDMLSRIHSQSSQPIQLPSPRRTSTAASNSPAAANAASPDKDEVFKVQQSPYLLNGAEGSDSYFAGTSSGRTFIEAFKHILQEKGRSTEVINTEKLLASSSLPESVELPPTPRDNGMCKAPPRLVSDRLINIFFQEWAPLFPVLHRPTFLSLYERYVNDTESVIDHAELALLNLVFGVASLSNGSRASSDLREFEKQWKLSIDSILNESAMPTLQALLLAQIFCVQQGDLTRLLTYKALSTTLSARLGLHQSQKRFALDTLTCETRKKVFWTLYTIDSFTAVMLGLPKHLKDEDIQCEYPVDADDEYISEHGFQPSLPGESTKLSSALALFRLARILSKVLEEVFPAKASYDLSLSTLSDLSDELDAWNSALAPHLRLQFAQDKPSTGTISSRSPLLSMAYHYIRALIHRPAVCASIGNRSSSSLIALASSSKHIIQITQLLEERGMCFVSCINKDELLVLSAFGLLFQSLKLDPASRMLKDNHKMVRTVVELLQASNAPCAREFDRVVATFLPSQETHAPSPPREAPPKAKAQLVRQDTTESLSEPSLSRPTSARKQLKAIASRFTANNRTPQLGPTDARRMTVHNISLYPDGSASHKQPSLQPTNLVKLGMMSRSEPARSPDALYGSPSSTAARPSVPLTSKVRSTTSPGPQNTTLNLDYLSFGGEQDNSDLQRKSCAVQPIKPEPQPTDWEKLLGSLDNGTTNIYDACYGGQPIEALLNTTSFSTIPLDKPTATASENSTSSVWGSADLWALYQTDTNTTVDSAHTVHSGQADSVLSFSSDDFSTELKDSRTSSDGLAYADWLSALDPLKLDSPSTSARASRHSAVASSTINLDGFWDHELAL